MTRPVDEWTFAPGWDAFWLNMRRRPLTDLIDEALDPPATPDRRRRGGDINALVREARDVLPKRIVQEAESRRARQRRHAHEITARQTAMAEHLLGIGHNHRENRKTA